MTLKRPGLVSLRRIDAWNLGIDFALEVYDLTQTFPREERFGLTSQMRRAAVSIPSNIAEGNQRRTIPDRRRFVTDAQGSIAELETQLEISSRLGYIGGPRFLNAIERTDHLARMLAKMYLNMTPRP